MWFVKTRVILNVVREDTNHGGVILNVVREDTNHGGKQLLHSKCGS
jgi:hypothetical protein